MAENELVQTGQSGLQVAVPQVTQLNAFLSYVEAVKKEAMKQGVDYDTIPNTNKPTLLKSGAEKLAFGFSFAAMYEVLDAIEDHFREWDYTVKRGEQTEEKTVRGFYFYRVKCTLQHRTTGETWGDCIASCASTERGRETAPANTIIKMAEKRAYVGAVLNATFSSDRFTQDLEDYKGENAPGRAGVDADTPPEMASKFDSKYPCPICGAKHQKGETIVQVPWNGKKQWIAKVCWLKASERDQPEETGPDAPFPTDQDAPM